MAKEDQRNTAAGGAEGICVRLVSNGPCMELHTASHRLRWQHAEVILGFTIHTQHESKLHIHTTIGAPVTGWYHL
jgi:hypothetical protein